ncbi:DNA repair protein RecO [Alicyclobacillus mengziensis]|uniref:DNA repair protein RecO n=1 Tax=Alicyclobacillus mengziensis TaxID=2931921 RepID=A0A9X7VVY9_9BACL|nr:DNA repair protein RecO [Alicyclobacillus mengziensis]QSO46101.1 DNA repair protein RecO [Alicyclobacillus mengziensis]
MLYNTEAYVIRTIPYGETHAIVTLLTPSGTIAAMARGAKKPQSRLAGGVQLCVRAMYTLYQGRGMGNIQQLEVVDSYRKLREELHLSAYGAYFCELVAACSEERPNGSEAVYRWFGAALDRLRDMRDKPQVVARIWEAKVLRLIGASPNWDACVRCHQPFGRDTAYYLPGEGGFVCSSCFETKQQESLVLEEMAQETVFPASSTRGAVAVPGTVPRILAQFSSVPWERIGTVKLGSNTEDAIRRVLRLQLHDYGGLSLKSRDFVDSIDELWSP